ncbi:transposase [Pseudomonas sp. MOB-449]|nr:transposase [Pseudomonas sp. MOB-449]
MPQERRSYTKSFKAQVIAECAQPDTSIANVALIHNLNANLVRMRPGNPSCVTRPVAIYAAAAPRSHSPAALAGA